MNTLASNMVSIAECVAAMKSAGAILGVLLAVAGIAGAMVSGLDPVYTALGAVVCAGGCALAWFMSDKGRFSEIGEDTITSGRSVQKPEKPTTKRSPNDMRGKL